MKTKYPSWFNATFKSHYKPKPPPKTIFEHKEVGQVVADQYSWVDLTSLPVGTDCASVKIDKDYYDNSISSVSIIFGKKEEIPNPNYETYYEHYKKQLKEYEERDKEWHQWKKIWDDEQIIITKEQRRRDYEKLKKEFENG